MYFPFSITALKKKNYGIVEFLNYLQINFLITSKKLLIRQIAFYRNLN